MNKYRCTGFCRLTDRDWKFLINHIPIRVKLYNEKRYIGIEHFPMEDRDKIKQIIINRIKKYQNEK
jgi:hypothetical protein